MQKVEFDRPKKYQYFKIIIRNILSLSFYKHIAYYVLYFIVNMSNGRRIIKIGKNSKIHPTVILREAQRIIIGDNCLINHNNVLQAGRKTAVIRIGNYVHTGPGVMMFAYNHSYDDINIPSILQEYYDGDIVIDDDVWIGAGTIILAGTKIGRGSIIAANSLVNKDVPSFVVVGGIPAKIIKNRVKDEYINS